MENIRLKHFMILLNVAIISIVNCDHNIVLVRQSEGNEFNEIASAVHPLRLTANRLKMMQFRFNIIYTSSNANAVESAEIIRNAMNINLNTFEDSVLDETNSNAVNQLRVEKAYLKYFYRPKTNQKIDTLILSDSRLIRSLVVR